MKITFKSSKNKKGFLALETLLGLIISVIALFFIFQVFYNVFFNMNVGNEKISNDNLNSIKNFIDFNINSENLNSNCFNILKLKNLINYQFAEEKKGNNFFYIIDKNGIYSIKFKNYDKIINSEKFTNYISNSQCFIGNSIFSKKCENFNNLNLYLDKTEQGSKNIFTKIGTTSINLLTYDLTSFGKFKNYLNFQKGEGNSFYILIPKLGKTQKQNDYEIKFINSNSIEKDILGNFLIFDKLNNKLFITKGEISNIIINKNLCFLKKLEKKDLNYYYLQNPLKINYIENDIFFIFSNSINLDKFSFEWKNKAICIKNDIKIECSKIDKIFSNLNINSYQSFYNKIKEFSLKMDSDINLNIKISKVKKIPKDKFINFNFVFTKTKIDLDNLKTKDKKIKNNMYLIKNGLWNSNINLNNCNSNLCNQIILENNKIYFYLNNLNSYYKFDEFLFRKQKELNSNKIKYFYHGNEIFYKEIEIKKVGDYIKSGDKFYLFRNIKIEKNNKNLNYDILLSKQQLSNIPEFEVLN